MQEVKKEIKKTVKRQEKMLKEELEKIRREFSERDKKWEEERRETRKKIEKMEEELEGLMRGGVEIMGMIKKRVEQILRGMDVEVKEEKRLESGRREWGEMVEVGNEKEKCKVLENKKKLNSRRGKDYGLKKI